MMTIMTVLWASAILMVSSTLNPVKMTICLIIFSTFTFLITFMSTSSAWFPMIFFLLFTGGILMMFMILSSILPNEKSMKMKNLNFTMIIMVAMMWLSSSSTIMQMVHNTKWFISSGHLFTATIILISLYFLSFLQILSKEEEPLRASSCQ